MIALGGRKNVVSVVFVLLVLIFQILCCHEVSQYQSLSLHWTCLFQGLSGDREVKGQGISSQWLLGAGGKPRVIVSLVWLVEKLGSVVFPVKFSRWLMIEWVMNNFLAKCMLREAGLTWWPFVLDPEFFPDLLHNCCKFTCKYISYLSKLTFPAFGLTAWIVKFY